MSYDEKLANRVREALEHLPDVTEKEMFSGICFMVDGKMCVCVSHDSLLCRVGAEAAEGALEHDNVSRMVMNGRPMKDYVYVSEDAFHHKKDFDHWIKLSLEFNPKAKASKKKK